ncbi:hypothetical protein OAH97_00920 [Octadecabacter sp.]|nr:hypothetical protein [Octadecabacter sp.]
MPASLPFRKVKKLSSSPCPIDITYDGSAVVIIVSLPSARDRMPLVSWHPIAYWLRRDILLGVPVIFKFVKKAFQRSLVQPSRFQGPFLVAPSPHSPLDLLSNEALDFDIAESEEPTVVSFGTRDGVYDVYAKRLQESCEDAGQKVIIETFPAMPSSNAFALKATFIKFKLLTLGQPVVWIDIDSVLKAPISLPSGDWDVGTLKNNRNNPKNPIASLCIAFRPTVAALRFLEHWEQFCSAHWLKPGEDHRRLNYTRFILDGHYMEADISEAVQGKLVRDVGKAKTHAF